MWAVTVGIVVLLLTIWLIWRKKKFSVFKEMGIPGPEPNILFGNLWELSAKGPLDCHKNWVKQYGRVLGYYFGAKPIILVADPELLKKIQVSEFRKFINRPPVFQVGREQPRRQDGFAKNLTILRDKRWKEIRSILTPSFTTGKMKMMAPIMNNAIDALMENIDEKAKSSETFDIYPMYQGLTMDVIGRTAFGIQTDVQRNPDDPLLRTARVVFSGSITSTLTVFAFSFPELGAFWNYMRRLRLSLRNRGINPIVELAGAVTDVIKMRRNDKSARRNDLLQSMMDAEMSEADLKNVKDQDLTAGDDDTQQEGQNEASDAATKQTSKLLRYMMDNEIVDNSILFFLAGYETTSTALAFTTHFLIHYPEVQERIRKEVNDLILREGTLDYTSVHKLQYLDQVFRESLRIYPPIYLFVNREAGEDVKYGDILIKKGFPVQVAMHVLHHDPELWTEPEKFDPERFSPERKDSIHPMAWQPFGAGPRNCVGMRFAQMEAKLALAKVLQKYKLVATEETDKEAITLRINPAIITPGKGVKLKAVPC